MLEKNGQTKHQERIRRAEQLNDLIVEAIQDVKGMDIVKLDLHELGEASADFFIICHGNTTTQVMGIADHIERKIAKELGVWPRHIEGTKLGGPVQDDSDERQSKGRQWVLVDYFSVVVHIFTKEKRPYYNLEYLWSDAKATRYENIS